MSKNGTFDCKGKININDWELNRLSLFHQDEVRNFINPRSRPSSCFKIFNDYNLQGCNILLNLGHYVLCMEATLKNLKRYRKIESFSPNFSQDKEKLYQLRSQVCEFIVQLRNILLSIRQNYYELGDLSIEVESKFDELLKSVLKFLKCFGHIPDSKFYYSSSNQGNKTSQPEYHIFHLHLELRWLVLTLINVRRNSEQNSDGYIEGIRDVLLMTINDLIHISAVLYSSGSNADLTSKTPFSCTCVRELWLMLQVSIDELSNTQNIQPFWDYVNTILNSFLDSNIGDLQFQRNVTIQGIKNPEIFSIWIIYHITMLYGYNKSGVYEGNFSGRVKSNSDQVEKILKNYVNKGGKEGTRDELDDELCMMIPLLLNVYMNWWKPNVSVIAQLWECYHKRLNQLLLIQSRGPWVVSFEKKSPMDLLKDVIERALPDNHAVSGSSFGMFLRLLSNFITKGHQIDPKFWPQLQGRIYSKFSKNKVAELNENGLYNFISLFLTLATCADCQNASNTMLSLLPNPMNWNALASAKKSCLIWKSRLAVLLLFNERELSFKNLASETSEMVGNICCIDDEIARQMMFYFIDVFKIIMTECTHFANYQHLFFGGWIDRYLKDYPSKKTIILVCTLISVFEKCNQLTENLYGGNLILNKLWDNVAGRIRQTITPIGNDESYQYPIKLAVLFTLNAIKDPSMGKKYSHSSASLFQHFTTSPIVKDLRISLFYLTSLLREDTAVESLRSEIQNFNIINIQVWVKYNMLNKDCNRDSEFLLNYVTKLNEFREMFQSELEINEILRSPEPIIKFFEILCKKRPLLQGENQKNFDTRGRAFIQKIDKWIVKQINDENKDSETSKWTYHCLGTLIFHCSPMLYMQNHPNDVLKILLKEIALPSDAVIHKSLISCTLDIFTRIVLGFEKLNIKVDLSLQSIFIELFNRYLPLLITDNGRKISDKLLSIFKDAANVVFIDFVYEVLTSNFITVPMKNETHRNCYLVMALIKAVIRGEKVFPVHNLKSIVFICTTNIIHCYIKVHDHHHHRQSVMYDFLRELSKNSYFKELSSLRDKLNEKIWEALNRYLSSNSQAFFNFLNDVFDANRDVFRFLFLKVAKSVRDVDRQLQSRINYLFDNLRKKAETAGITT